VGAVAPNGLASLRPKLPGKQGVNPGSCQRIGGQCHAGRSEANQGAGAFEENGGVTGMRKSIKNLNISVKVPESKQ
jgi:hypothetical protein